jgi:putative flippase GtrA
MTQQGFASDLIRFLIAGGLNTALTTLVYFGGLLVMPSSVSYALAWLAGLVLVLWLYPERVFPGSRTSIADRAAIGVSIAAVFVVGLILLGLLRAAIGGQVLPFFITLAATTALNFVVSRWILRRR